VKGRRGRRRKQLLDFLKKMRVYLKLKEEVLDRSLCRISFGRGYGPVVRQTKDEYRWVTMEMRAENHVFI